MAKTIASSEARQIRLVVAQMAATIAAADGSKSAVHLAWRLYWETEKSSPEEFRKAGYFVSAD